MKPKENDKRVTRFFKRISSSTRKQKDLLRINSIYLFNLIVTSTYLVMFWIEFINPKFHVAITRCFIYLVSLTFYIIYKEVQRWLGRHIEKRPGEIWVLAWWSSVFLMEIISFAKLETLRTPKEQYIVAVVVSVNFILSRLSKCMFNKQIDKIRDKFHLKNRKT